jgi:hypothetical protein
MASSITLRIGNLTSTITPTKTDVEIATILNLFIADWAGPPPEGLTVAELNKWKLDQATRRVADMISAEARRVRLRQLREAQADLEAQASSETGL